MPQSVLHSLTIVYLFACTDEPPTRASMHAHGNPKLDIFSHTCMHTYLHAHTGVSHHDILREARLSEFTSGFQTPCSRPSQSWYLLRNLVLLCHVLKHSHHACARRRTLHSFGLSMFGTEISTNPQVWMQTPWTTMCDSCASGMIVLPLLRIFKTYHLYSQSLVRY